jgi:hypothetical protein
MADSDAVSSGASSATGGVWSGAGSGAVMTGRRGSRLRLGRFERGDAFFKLMDRLFEGQSIGSAGHGLRCLNSDSGCAIWEGSDRRKSVDRDRQTRL